MRHWVIAVVLGCAVPALALAERKPVPDPARFKAAFEEGWHLVKLGRRLEGQVMLANLSWRLDQFDPQTRFQFADQLASALASLSDHESVERVHQRLVDACVLDMTHSRTALENLPVEPQARGLELCRLALALPPDAIQRKMLLRGAMGALERVSRPTAETRHRLALCCLELGQRARASELLHAAVAMDPASPGPRMALARSALAKGKPAHALELLEKVLGRGVDREGGELLAQILTALDASGDAVLARATAGAWNARTVDARGLAPVRLLAAGFAEKDGLLQQALLGYCRVLQTEPDARAMASAMRIASTLANRSPAELHAARVALTDWVKPVGTTSSELLRLVGDLAHRDHDERTAIRMYGAGLSSRDRTGFEQQLVDLRRTFRASNNVEMAAEVDLVSGPPRSFEPDKTYALVQLEEDTCAVDVVGGTIAGKLPANAKLAQFATTIAQVLKEYPPELVQKLKLWKFKLVDAAALPGTTAASRVDAASETIHVNMQGPATPTDWRLALHHEIFHLVDDQDDGITRGDAAWRLLNRPGFLYSAKDVPCEPTSSATAVEVPGFVHTTAAGDEAEDKAATFANMMVNLPTLDERASHDTILAAKMEKMRRTMKVFIPKMDDAFWDSVRARSQGAAPAAAGN